MSYPATVRSAWLVWTVALSTYFVAVFHRSSLAVAGLVATDRFHISAAQLAAFAMLQLGIYALMQIPVGLLVDRFGPRSVLLTGAVVLTVAQAGFAVADSYGAALLARLFVGVGDAMTFVCVLRLVNAWFAPGRVPLITQLTGVVGQIGAIVAAVPMTWALAHLGWTTAYGISAGFGVAAAVVALIVLHDQPGTRNLRGPNLSLGAIRASLALSWQQPGTRLGFWVHFTTQFAQNAFALLWGFPFLVKGEGVSPNVASVLLTLMVVSLIAAGPLMGWFTARHPWQRSTLALAVVGAIATAWTLVLAWPGRAPLGLLVVLVMVIGLGGPGSMIGFDLGRTSNPLNRLASATGIINQAGFVASLTVVVAIGAILDWRTGGTGSDYTPDAFRWAMSFQYVLWALGAVQIWRYRVRGRAHALSLDPLAPTRTALQPAA
ncbi:nitrate/nitrite transporter [Cryptosporangium sp. NPDC051539]|uniref:nitrate/nitrite transporter n=1 Tax=Cryptosporangium sp. NPDC051539 TaxID=3363962 RepID=UPI0037A90A29